MNKVKHILLKMHLTEVLNAIGGIHVSECAFGPVGTHTELHIHYRSTLHKYHASFFPFDDWAILNIDGMSACDI